jgi:stage V sporulation protein R
MTLMDSKSDIERLRDGIDAAWEEARKFGLDPFPTHFELVPASVMYEFASYGLPGRFSHWTFGKAYYRQKMQYDLGLSKIYEMVVNTNPSYAFLMEMNNLLQNTFVAAHVFGHTDFFKNNAYFQHTSRRMIDKASINAERIAKYEFDHGKAEVERFLDAALSIQEHIDYNLLLRENEPQKRGEKARSGPTTAYDDLWGLDKRAQRAEEERDKRSGKPPKFPEKPEKDLLLFLMRHAPHLKDWQRDILEIARSEMLYFVPQMQTKTMNEGWACLIGDSIILTEMGFLRYDALHEMLAQGKTVKVGSGNRREDQVTDRHMRHNAPTIRLHTQRGLVLEGAQEHKLSIGPEQWIALKDVHIGQRIPLSAGDNIWPEQLVAEYVGEACAEFLGYLVGSGKIDSSRHAVSFTTGDLEQAERYAQLVTELFALEAIPCSTDETVSSEGSHWHLIFHSADALDLLCTLRAKAQDKAIPDAMLRSPKSVMSAFLRAYFDCSGHISPTDGITLSTFSAESAQTVQIVLLNYGILSWRSGPEVRIEGEAARIFAQEIGFALARKHKKLEQYLSDHQWLCKENPTDEVISIEHGVADVYDITVQHTHRYIANGMLHHNSFWHARIMRELADQGVISSAEYIEFAQLHSGVLSPSRVSLNPYYVGFKVLEDIERRWDNPTKEEQERLGRKPGRGREKIFEVREMENDVSFLRNYLTEDLVKDLDLYLYKKEGDTWVIVEKNWQKVRDTIVTNMTNFGYPYLVVENGDYRGNRELYIKHMYEGQELDLVYAERTLQHVFLLWGRPVHLETLYDNKRILLTYDGERNTKSTLEK